MGDTLRLQSRPGTAALGLPHVRLDVQELQRRHTGLPRHVLQDLESRAAVLVELGADVEQRLAGPPELLAGDAFVHLLPRHALALLQQVQVVPACRQRTKGLAVGKLLDCWGHNGF